ncbi:MAG TPA: DUF1028 domain-containing protein, partial [Thermoplasmata archaeon]|nr:DUF1028 domain-containing protein [Thermoplasmata archaeon]
IGVAVESKFPAVGAAVPFAIAGVGAVATQAWANTTYGPHGLAMLKRRMTPQQVVKALTATDKERAKRQVGVVDRRGRVASFTGKECQAWAGHLVGKNYACQGNILASEDVVKGMARGFERTEGDLPAKLLSALVAGQDAGGDRRGQQSAALLVVRAKGGYAGFNDRWIDLRVDDHPRPIEELIRIFHIWDLTMLTREDPRHVVEITHDVAATIQRLLAAARAYDGPVNGKWDAGTQEAFEAWMGVENLENKIRKDGKLWGSVWRYVQDRAGRR